MINAWSSLELQAFLLVRNGAVVHSYLRIGLILQETGCLLGRAVDLGTGFEISFSESDCLKKQKKRVLL